ncbi:coatomer gamma subunit, partial [Trypanosoma cruzi]
KESVLKHLAEFIDDCNYSQIVRRVLMYLGEEVPLTENPKTFVRYVYNHATLEGPEIRAVAVSTLAKLAAYVPSLRRSIVVLLKRTCNDADDEVRDRAVLYTRIFLNNDENIIRSMVCDVANTVAMSRQARIAARSAVLNTVAEDIGRQKAIAKEAESGTEEASAVSHAVLQGREKMQKIKQLLELGEPLVSSEPVPLTDPDSEYVVTVMKHTYISNIVLQFKVKNTMEKVTFKNIAIELDTDEVGVEPQYFIPIESVAPASTSYGYAVLRYEEEQYPSGTVECRFKFAMQEEGGDVEEEEEYPLEGFD